MLLFSDLISGWLWILLSWLTRLSRPGLAKGNSGFLCNKEWKDDMSLWLFLTTMSGGWSEEGLSLPLITLVPVAFWSCFARMCSANESSFRIFAWRLSRSIAKLCFAGNNDVRLDRCWRFAWTPFFVSLWIFSMCSWRPALSWHLSPQVGQTLWTPSMCLMSLLGTLKTCSQYSQGRNWLDVSCFLMWIFKLKGLVKVTIHSLHWRSAFSLKWSAKTWPLMTEWSWLLKSHCLQS